MNLYTCRVRLSGSVQNEVIKEQITAAEVMLLRRIHGKESVLNIKWVGQETRNVDEERMRLLQNYTASVDHEGEPVPLVLVMFPEGREFPLTIPGVEIPKPDERDEPDIEAIRARGEQNKRKPRKMFDRSDAEKEAS